MTEFSVCSVLGVPYENDYYGEYLFCGSFKSDPQEALQDHRAKADAFIKKTTGSAVCGTHNVRFIARNEGDWLFGTGTNPSEAVNDMSRMYKIACEGGFFRNFKTNFGINLINLQLDKGEPIPFGLAELFFDPPLCSLPYEARSLDCYKDFFSNYLCGIHEYLYEERAELAKEEKSYEPCSKEPYAPTLFHYIDEECKDPNYYIERGMFVPPPSQLGDENTIEADRIKYLADPPWAGQQYD